MNKKSVTIFLITIIIFLGQPIFASIDDHALVAHWKFDESGGTTVFDASDNGLDGEIIGRGSFVNGVYGNAIDFKLYDTTGVNYIKVPYNAHLAIGDGTNASEMTISAWIRFTEGRIGDHLNIVAMKGSKWNHPWGYRCEAGNGQRTAIYMSMYGGGPNVWGSKAAASKDSTGDWTPDKWFHVAYSVINNRAYLFKNGVRVGSNSAGSPFILVAAPDSIDLIIGGATNDGWGAFSGSMDDVRIYNAGTSDETEIQAIMNHIVEIKSVKTNAVKYLLTQNYPNPFNPSTTINYSVPRAAHVRITVWPGHSQSG